MLPVEFAIVLAAYYVLTFAYSFSLKRQVLIDVVTLPRFIPSVSLWCCGNRSSVVVLVAGFSTFLFLSLAILKRYTELLVMKQKALPRLWGGYRQ